MNHPIPVTLSESERASLQTFIHAGKANARTFTRARVLLKAAEGWSDQQICDALDISRNTSIRVREMYLEGGLEAVLHDKRHQRLSLALRVDRQPISSPLRAVPFQLATTIGPFACWLEKRSNWATPSSISPETIRQLLKKTNSSLGNTSSGASQP